jgi:hypothetical protein
MCWRFRLCGCGTTTTAIETITTTHHVYPFTLHNELLVDIAIRLRGTKDMYSLFRTKNSQSLSTLPRQGSRLASEVAQNPR